MLATSPVQSIWARTLAGLGRDFADWATDVALYVRHPFVARFELVAASTATERDESSLVDFSQPLFEGPAATPSVFLRADDILVRAWRGTASESRSVLLLPVRSQAAPLRAVVAIGTERTDLERRADILRATREALERLTATIEMYLFLRRSEAARTFVTGQMHELGTSSLLGALVPDAASSNRPLMAACTIVEGRAELNNRVVIERSSSLASPTVVVDEIEYQLALWSFGSPAARAGLGSIGDPDHLFGRIASEARLGLFAFSRDFGPADRQIECAPLRALEQQLSSRAHESRRPSPHGLIDSDADSRSRVTAAMSDVRRSLPQPDGTTSSSETLDLADVFCVGIREQRPIVVTWPGDGSTLWDAFSVTSAVHDSTGHDVHEREQWLGAVQAELLSKRRSAALMRVLSALVQCSADAGGDVDGRVHEAAVETNRWPSLKVHGPAFPDGVMLAVRWTNSDCTVDICYHGATVRSRWRLSERYLPAAVFSVPCITHHRTIEGLQIRYPPADTHCYTSFSKQDAVTEREGWEAAHHEVFAQAFLAGAQLWSGAISGLVGIPLPYRGASTHLDAVEWASGDGPRRFALVGMLEADFAADPLDEALQILAALQDGAVPRLRDTTAEIDRVLVGHLQHDLATLRAGFSELERVATQAPLEESVSKESLRRTIRDVEDKLDGLETVSSLYSAIEASSVVDLDLLEGSLPLAIRRGATRARKKLGRNVQEEERLAALVAYAPPPPSRLLPPPSGIAVLLLENILGNAICASERVPDVQARAYPHAPVVIERRSSDEALIIKNICNEAEWNQAKDRLQNASHSSRGLSLILQASRVCGVRLVTGDARGGMAEVHLIPQGSRQ